MVVIARRFPITSIPEQPPIAFVCYPVIHSRRRRLFTLVGATLTPRIVPQESALLLGPLGVVAALGRGRPLLVEFRLAALVVLNLANAALT